MWCLHLHCYGIEYFKDFSVQSPFDSLLPGYLVATSTSLGLYNKNEMHAKIVRCQKATGRAYGEDTCRILHYLVFVTE